MSTEPAPAAGASRTLLPIVVGSIGAVLIAISSLAVGWLGPHSNVLEWALLEWFRESEPRRAVLSVAVILGGCLLVTGWLWLGLRLRVLRTGSDPVLALPTLVKAALAWGLPLLVCVPMYSRDMFSYVAQGHLILGGGNPYQEGVAELPDWFGMGVDPMWSEVKTPYGPVILGVGAALVRLSGDSPVVAVALFRLLAVAGLVATAWYAHRIVTMRGGDRVAVQWLVLASPLSLMVFVASGHHDSVMLALILAGIHSALRHRPWPAIVLIALAVGIKPIAVVALPIIGLVMAGPQRRQKLLWTWWAVSGAVTAAVLGLVGLIMGLGFGWVSALGTPGAVSHWYAPGNWFIQIPAALTDLFGSSREAGLEAGKLLLTGVMVVVVVWVYLTRRPLDPLVRVTIAFTAMVVLSPFIHPWYASWVVVLAAITARPGLELLPHRTFVLAAVTTFFSWVAFVDTTDSPAEVGGSSWPVVVRVTTNALTAAVLAVILFRLRIVDRQTAVTQESERRES